MRDKSRDIDLLLNAFQANLRETISDDFFYYAVSDLADEMYIQMDMLPNARTRPTRPGSEMIALEYLDGQGYTFEVLLSHSQTPFRSHQDLTVSVRVLTEGDKTAQRPSWFPVPVTLQYNSALVDWRSGSRVPWIEACNNIAQGLQVWHR